MWGVRERQVEGESESLGQSYWENELGKSVGGKMRGGDLDMLRWRCLLDIQVETISRLLEDTADINLGWLLKP